MEVIGFNAPENADALPGEGWFLVDPTINTIINLLRREAEYWGEDSGSASLRWYEQQERREDGKRGFVALKNRPSLNILFHKEFGFHFVYSSGDGGQPLVPYDISAPDRRIVHYLDGERAYFPVQTFVRLPVAEAIVRDFMDARTASSAVTWESARKLRCGDSEG
jgi:hypothetical protein